MTKTLKIAALTLAALSLGACASSQYAEFEKDGISDEQLYADAADCGAIQQEDGSVSVPLLYRVTFDDCMKDKGYSFSYL